MRTKKKLSLKINETHGELLGMGMHLDLVEKQLGVGIKAICELQGIQGILSYNLRVLSQDNIISSLNSYRQTMDELESIEQRIKESFMIYNNVRRERESYLGRYNRLMAIYKEMSQELLTEGDILPFRKRNDETYQRRDQTKDRD